MDQPGVPPAGASARYRSLLERLFALSRTGMTLGLAGISRVLGSLGHPELAYPSVHIAGSNGKGSTAAFTAAILGAAGHKVGLYTSPHLISLTERVQLVEGLRAREISPEALADAVERVEEVAPDFGGLSFFEVLTAAGLVALEKERVSYAVIEAGLGARLDATRLVDARVSVLTDLALEHTEVLGSTLEEIASEKSAVIRAGRPLVAADAPAGAARVIEQACEHAGAELHRIGRELSVAPGPDHTFDLDLGDRRLSSVRLSLLGPHQGRNALLAAKAACLAVPGIDDDAIRRGLESARWPGRMEVLRLPMEPPILLDGAHNPQGAEILARALDEHRGTITPPLHFVFGVLADKDAAGMIDALAPRAASMVITRPGSPRARPPAEVLAMLEPVARARAEIVEGVEAALRVARARARDEGGWVVVAGSLYLVGDARALLLGAR